MCEPIEWIRNLGHAPLEYRDQYVFVSVVHAIFEQDRNLVIRDLLTYLLLRRNPATNVEVPLDHPIENVDTPEKIVLLREASRREITRYVEHHAARPYVILQLLLEINKSFGARWANGEETTLLILSLWLFSEELRPQQLLTKCACLKLAFEDHFHVVDIGVNEFVYDRLGYLNCIVGELDRLFTLEYSTEEIVRELSYLGAFASLVRACRIAETSHPIHEILRDEVAWLQVETTRR